MDLLEALGPDSGLFQFPIDDVVRAMRSFRIDDYQTQNLVLANYAELVAFGACMAGNMRLPLVLPPEALPFAIYKTNTITYTCGYHHGEGEPRSEYAFLFTSDCWKLREILQEDPLPSLIRNPLAVRDRVIESGWQLVAANGSDQNMYRDLMVLLWFTKAMLIANPEAARTELRNAVIALHQRLELPRG